MNKKNKYNILFALFLLLVGCFSASCTKDDENTTDNTSTFAPISSEEALKVQKSLLGKYRSKVYVYDPTTKKNYYSNSRLDFDSLIIDNKWRNYDILLTLSSDTYLRLHDIEKNGINDTLSKIFSKQDKKDYLGIEGIRFTSRNQQDSCVYRVEVSEGIAEFSSPGHDTTSRSYLKTDFNGYGYYNVKTSMFKIYLRPVNAYIIRVHEPSEYRKIPLTGRYLIYELTKVQ